MESESANGNQATSSETSEIHFSFAVILFAFSFLILAANLLTIISVLQFTNRKNTFSLLIVSLSLTEVLNVLGPNGIALHALFDKDKGFQDLFTLCRVQAWIAVFLRVSASLVITLLALDRVFATALPRFYHNRWKGKLFVLFFFGIWMCAAFIATCPLLWLEGFHVSTDSQGAFCLFPYNSSFARFFVLFILCLLAICCFSFYTMFSMSNKKSFTTTDLDLASSKQRIATRDVHTRSKQLSRMVTLVIVVYFCCILPWMVAISLSIFAVDYPPLFGLCAIQLPMVSGFFNPLLYGIMWPPYRRAYIRALKWPGVKCCTRKASSRARSHTLNSSLSTNHSFWLSDSFADEDADYENAFHILFGPTSYIKPLDFNPEELEMFEQNSKLRRSSKPKRAIQQQTKAAASCENGGNHFQNILDLIDAMTDRNKKSVCEIGFNTNIEASHRLDEDSAHNKPADNTSTRVRRHCGDLELSFGSDSSLIPGVCREHRNSSAGCSCLGKSKCYLVERKNRQLNYLVSKDPMENTCSLESVVIEI